MNDQPEKPRSVKPLEMVNSLVRAQKKSNEKTFRVQLDHSTTTSQEYQINSFRRKKFNGNVRLNPKPLIECFQPEPLLTSKPFEKSILQREKKNKPTDDNHFECSDDDDVDKPDISPGKSEVRRSTLYIRQPSAEHLSALKKAFNKILFERSLSDQSLQQQQFIFMKLRELIINYRADALVILYGSIYFECCLEKPGMMDIDVQFHEVTPHKTLKPLTSLIKSSDICKEVMIDTDYKPSCINLITNEPNMRVRITSGFHRGIHLSELIRIYTKFDCRLIKLLRLFRILAKICNIDRPDIGTLHPIVFHIMIIHFLQQVEPPVLPCLHEYAYGIDNVPLILIDDQYPEFIGLCEKYSKQWKSSNETDIEMLFLQCLSYYVKTFYVKQLVVSIQTRMPVMKIDKNWHSRELLIEDPTDIKRSLNQTMSSVCSTDYFCGILNTALNYFGRKQKPSKKTLSDVLPVGNNDEDLIETINDEENDEPKFEPKNLLHNSYKLFFKCLPPTVVRDANMRQARVREYYKRLFDNKNDFSSKGLLRLHSANNQFDEFNENHIRQVLKENLNLNEEIDDEQNEQLFDTDQQSGDEQQDAEDNQQQINDRELSSNNDGEEQKIVENDISPEINENHQNIESLPAPTDEKSNSDCSNIVIYQENSTNIDNIPASFISPIKILLSINNDKKKNENENSFEFFYNFKPENFHAEQGSPYICTICDGIGHLKRECPDMILLNMVELPDLDEKCVPRNMSFQS